VLWRRSPRRSSLSHRLASEAVPAAGHDKDSRELCNASLLRLSGMAAGAWANDPEVVVMEVRRALRIGSTRCETEKME